MFIQICIFEAALWLLNLTWTKDRVVEKPMAFPEFADYYCNQAPSWLRVLGWLSCEVFTHTSIICYITNHNQTKDYQTDKLLCPSGSLILQTPRLLDIGKQQQHKHSVGFTCLFCPMLELNPGSQKASSEAGLGWTFHWWTCTLMWNMNHMSSTLCMVESHYSSNHNNSNTQNHNHPTHQGVGTLCWDAGREDWYQLQRSCS